MKNETKTLPIVYSCSGCSNVAQLANHVAVRLDRSGDAEMSCIAGVGGDVPSLLKLAHSGRPIIAIDGCPLVCAKKASGGTGSRRTRMCNSASTASGSAFTRTSTRPTRSAFLRSRAAKRCGSRDAGASTRMTAPRASTSARMPHCKTRCDFVREHRGRLVGVWLARQSSGGIDACVACGESALGVVVAECILRSGASLISPLARTRSHGRRAHARRFNRVEPRNSRTGDRACRAMHRSDSR